MLDKDLRIEEVNSPGLYLSVVLARMPELESQSLSQAEWWGRGKGA